MKYYIRLDDACEYQKRANWDRMEMLLKKYDIEPLVGVIPCCKDPEIIKYKKYNDFWDQVKRWEGKGWKIALHGCHHLYMTKCGGLNPIQKRSEFAGVPLRDQIELIKRGLKIFEHQGIHPNVFYAPSHTFDRNTVAALKYESDIRIISDTIAIRPYTMYGMTFVPQQMGRVRAIIWGEVTFCYHPNMMKNKDFLELELFLEKYANRFKPYPIEYTKKGITSADKAIRIVYFCLRKVKRILKGERS